MAQTGNFTPILLYSSSTAGNTPGAASLLNSADGSELAINIADGKLFYKDSSNAVQVIAWKTTPTTAGGTGLTAYTAGDTVYYASGTTLSKLAIGSANYIMTSSGTAPQWSASIGPAQGGTGITSYAVGDLIYASGTTTLSKLADVATGNALISGGVGVAPSWGKIGLTTHVSGTLGTGNGGTGLTSFTSGGLVYASSTSALTTSASLTFDTASLINTAGGFRSTVGGIDGIIGAGSFVSGTYGIGTVTNTPIAFAPNLTERMRLHASGGLSLGNTTDPGAGNLQFTTAGTNGVKFGTGTLLKNYEEGTFTPTVTSSIGTITTYTASGIYTKIGRQVTVSINISITTNGTGNGSISATLPFQAGANIYVGSGRENAVTGLMLQALINASTSTVTILSAANGYAGGTGYQLLVTNTYFV